MPKEILLTLFFILIQPYPGFGQPATRVLVPSLSAQHTYESNIFKQRDVNRLRLLVNDSQRGDYYTRYRAGLKLTLPVSKQLLSLQGAKDFVRFNHYRDQNYSNELVKADLDLSYRDSFFISPGYHYSKNLVLRTFNTDKLDNEFQKENRLILSGSYNSNRLKFKLSYWEEGFSFRLANNRNRDINSLTSLIRLLLSARSELFVALSRKEFSFLSPESKLDHMESNATLGGMTNIGGKTRLSFEFGFRDKNFSTSKSLDFTVLLLKASCLWQITSKTSLKLQYQRDTEISYFDETTFSINERYRADILWKVSPKITSKLLILRRFAENIVVSGNAHLKNQEYLTAGWEGGYQLSGQFSLDMIYKFQKRSANLEEFDYDNSLVTLGLSFLLN